MNFLYYFCGLNSYLVYFQVYLGWGVFEVDMPVTKLEHCLHAEQVKLALCAALLFWQWNRAKARFSFIFSVFFVGLGWDLDLLLVVWRWFMGNNLSNFILFYISGCLYCCGLNVMSTVLHVIWIAGIRGVEAIVGVPVTLATELRVV